MSGPKDRSPFPNHRGLATWGQRLVPLDEFRHAVAGQGRRLSDPERIAAVREHRAVVADPTPVEGPFGRVAVFGGVYSNHLALEALIEDARGQGVEALYCLGDLGGFGPTPEKVWPLMRQAEVRTVKGNYEQSLAAASEDCNCGYTDPRDNHFAAVSYAYTARECSDAYKSWMAQLPGRRRIRVGQRELLLCHGSPRQINEFLFGSTSPVSFLEKLVEQQRCDGFLCTHTGLHWKRRLPSGRDVVNVGVIGRPANDGDTGVWYCLLEAAGSDLRIELRSLKYDHGALAREMQEVGLPGEFVETILTGWWSTCLEILPAKERAASRY